MGPDLDTELEVVQDETPGSARDGHRTTGGRDDGEVDPESDIADSRGSGVEERGVGDRDAVELQEEGPSGIGDRPRSWVPGKRRQLRRSGSPISLDA